MPEVLASVICICMGVTAFVFRVQFARAVVDFSNKTSPFKYGDREIAKFTRGNIFIAASMVLFGVFAFVKALGWF